MLTAVLLAAAAQVQEAPSSSERLGLTASQIAAMTPEAWSAKYTSRFRETTMTLIEANTVYSWALQSVNDRGLARQSTARRRAALAFRKHASEFRFGCSLCSRVIGGGGTLWNVVDSEVPTAVESTLRKIMQGRTAKPKGDYRRGIDAMVKDLRVFEAREWSPEPDGRTQGEALKAAALLPGQASRALKAAAAWGPNASGVVRQFLYESVQINGSP